tara:strand:+ start:97 stop:1473 length:1377 start_codon:yes stop_codon:yes gene_type:complete
MLPALDRLSLSRTGEFYPLSQAEVDALNKDGAQEPFSTEPYQKDVDAYGFGNWRRFVPGVQPNNEDAQWHTFRVRSTEPSADGTYKYRYYRAESLWRWHKDNRNDPITREPIWYEDWWALHDAYDKEGLVPSWVYTLPTRDPGTIVVRPAQPIPLPSMTRTLDNRGNGREWAFAEESGDEDDASGMPPGTPTPIPVHRQPNTPNSSSERLRVVDERLDAYQRADLPSEHLVARRGVLRAYRWAEVAYTEALIARTADTFYDLLDAQWNADEAMKRVSEVLRAQSTYGQVYLDEYQEYETFRQAEREQRERDVAVKRERYDSVLRTVLNDEALLDELRAKQLVWDRMCGPFTRRPTVYELEDQDVELRIVEELVIGALRASIMADLGVLRLEAQDALSSIQKHATHRGNLIYRWRQADRGEISMDFANRNLYLARSGWFALEELIPPSLDPTTDEGWDD